MSRARASRECLAESKDYFFDEADSRVGCMILYVLANDSGGEEMKREGGQS